MRRRKKEGGGKQLCLTVVMKHATVDAQRKVRNEKVQG